MSKWFSNWLTLCLCVSLALLIGFAFWPTNGQTAEQKMVLMHELGGGVIDDPTDLAQILERGTILEDGGDGRLCVVQAINKETGWLNIVCRLGDQPVPRKAEELSFRFVYTRNLSGILYHHKAMQFLEQE